MRRLTHTQADALRELRRKLRDAHKAAETLYRILRDLDAGCEHKDRYDARCYVCHLAVELRSTEVCNIQTGIRQLASDLDSTLERGPDPARRCHSVKADDDKVFRCVLEDEHRGDHRFS